MSHNFSWHTSNESNRLLSLLAVILCCVALLKSIYHIRDEKKNNSDGTRFIALIGSNCKEYSFYFFFLLGIVLPYRREEVKVLFLIELKDRSRRSCMHSNIRTKIEQKTFIVHRSTINLNFPVAENIF